MTAQDQYVLVTGANSGLGLGICCRLVDEYLASADGHGTLTIIYTTRSQRKGAETLSSLEKHLARPRHGSHHKKSDRRVRFNPENVELTSLLSVRALSRKLLDSDIPHLDAIVLNAGIGGWSGLNWPLTIYNVLTGIRQATTWPTFKLGVVGLVTRTQFPPHTKAAQEEPVLGEVFCANTFGHYMLVHWLMPLIRACPSGSPGKIVWVSSIEASAHHYNPDDHQGLRSSAAYEHTKRLTDLMALTAVSQPATAASVREYITPSPSLESAALTRRTQRSEPSFLVAHPGICTTTIISLYWIVHQCYRLGIYLARWCGSPWANVTSYLGAASVTWLVLASQSEINAKAAAATAAAADSPGGPCKWGSACDRLGRSSVRVSDVEGWGINGTGTSFRHKWWGGSLGRKTGAVDATREDVEDFISQGAEVWKKMESMRKDWEDRIEVYEDPYEFQKPR
ncbi:3-keto-steroid reductase [Exophiala xenobiotica]|uniref:3-keto-steroid reductase n=1 Tax=Vermiconidia calcicola TaxID=1690605 RepID=A0AAV9QD97_9PEZI|nr:3-keto-steroid reductase [Exophiala xenobiotica]KAK5533712.1 3-keto-steroid reductase [Chaetothyriales sp. CCFEE 6169]KAK5537846.1 3-keto-steroid reductase [Vermiconidia calcicola]KAK5205274.1 3-keto-steroid reductase [Exophiala xenobiotica]KAK5218949.1 3-keto-steroid reductase [Exophiala xenobiotica]